LTGVCAELPPAELLPLLQAAARPAQATSATANKLFMITTLRPVAAIDK